MKGMESCVLYEGKGKEGKGRVGCDRGMKVWRRERNEKTDMDFDALYYICRFH